MAELVLYLALLSLVSVGGVPSVLPEMQRLVVETKGWMSAAEFARLPRWRRPRRGRTC
ncbi:MAG: hypothetical protein RML56_12055 [Burkholderiales bacterium]|nr:hypothetical protein [Burkholderiales bacterium]